MSVERFDDDMNVVRHDAPSQQPITLPIEVQQTRLNECGNFGIAEPALAQSGVEFPVHKQYCVWLQAQCLDPSLRQAVGQAKGDELDSLRRVEVRQVASAMPASWLRHES